jgi:CO dehydrogenase nickel-insertion accessory protein CooC1
MIIICASGPTTVGGGGVRIAFVGKGGSGKTTSAAVFSRYLAELGKPVLAIDADINQHLGQALGHDGPPPARSDPTSRGSRSTCGAATRASRARTR